MFLRSCGVSENPPGPLYKWEKRASPVKKLEGDLLKLDIMKELHLLEDVLWYNPKGT